MKKTLLSFAFLASITAIQAQETIFEDSFEAYDDFTIDNFGDWIQIDLDGGQTWGVTELGDFPNVNYVGAGIIFNSTALDPDPGPDFAAHTGEKGLYFFASGANGTTFPNDDYTISPLISLDGYRNTKVSLYAKASTNIYGPDQFQIKVSTGGTNPGDFDEISDVIVPGTDYTFYEFDLSDYDGEDVLIAIHVTTNDGLLLMMDDFLVTGEEALGTSDFNTAVASIYPNPASDILNIDLSPKFDAAKVSVSITDMVGKKVLNFRASDSYNISALANGIYMVNITDGTYTATHKIVKK